VVRNLSALSIWRSSFYASCYRGTSEPTSDQPGRVFSRTIAYSGKGCKRPAVEIRSIASKLLLQDGLLDGGP
jgi:hypothetical protein